MTVRQLVLVTIAATTLLLLSISCRVESREGAPTPESAVRNAGPDPSAPTAVVSPEERDEILALVLRQLFEERPEPFRGERINLIFVGVGDPSSLSDPSSGLLANVKTDGREVLPQSDSHFDLERGVRHKTTDRRGVLFFAELRCFGHDEAVVRAGYVEHGKIGARFLVLVERVEGSWVIKEGGRVAVS